MCEQCVGAGGPSTTMVADCFGHSRADKTCNQTCCVAISQTTMMRVLELKTASCRLIVATSLEPSLGRFSPIAKGHKPAATTAALPEEDPPAKQPGSWGLRVMP